MMVWGRQVGNKQSNSNFTGEKHTSIDSIATMEYMVVPGTLGM